VTAIQPVLPCELRRWIVLLVNPRPQCYRRQNVRATRLHWAMLNMRGAGWLFPSENLKMPIGADNMMARYIRPKLKADNVGLGWVDYRVMRRTHSSLMNAHGVDPKVIADQQGHTVDVNLNVYTQTSVESRREAAETLASAFVN
jgi:hypothetical protein